MSIFLTDSLVLLQGTDSALVPLNHSRICYQTFTRDVIPAVSSAAVNWPASALANCLTNDRWQPTSSPATVTFDFSTDRFIDYVAIGAHTIGTALATVKIETSEDDVTYTEVSEFLPANNRAILALFAEIEVRYLRIALTYSGDAPQIGVIYCGKALAMQRGMYGGHSPVTLSRVNEMYPRKSDSGHFLGNSVVRKGFATKANWRNLTAPWYRANFDPFVESAIRYPYFFAWNPLRWSSEVALCWTPGDIQPSNMGVRDLMEVGIDIQAYGANQ